MNVGRKEDRNERERKYREERVNMWKEGGDGKWLVDNILRNFDKR